MRPWTSRKAIRERKVSQFAPAGVGRSFLVHNGDLRTLSRGLIERVMGRVVNDELLPPLEATHNNFDEMRWFRKKLGRFLPILTSWSYNDVVATYDGQKRKLYQQSNESLRLRPLSRLDAVRGAFVKFETIDCSVKVNPKPRIILPAHPRFNLSLGRYTKPAEKALYASIDKLCGGVSVVKGLNAEQTALAIVDAFTSVKDCVCLPMDMSHADRSVDTNLHRSLFSLLRDMYGPDPELDKLESYSIGKLDPHTGSFVSQIKARCRDGNASVTGVLGLSSGMMYTSMIMVHCIMGMTLTYLEEVGLRKKCRIINNGDDFLIFVPKKYKKLVDGLPAYYLKWGFKAVVEEGVDVVEQISFCQCQPIFDGQTWIMVRDPRTALSKDLLSVQVLDSRPKFDYFRDAKSRCGLSLTRGIPVCQAFYEMLGRGARPNKKDRKIYAPQSGMEYMVRGMKRDDKVITAEARYSFFLAFGVIPDSQIAMERAYTCFQPDWGPETRVEVFTQNLINSTLINYN